MSKAFTRESDADGEALSGAAPVFRMPDGVPNYITRSGARRLRSELDVLLAKRRTLVASAAEGDPSAAELVRRIRYLSEALDSAQSPPSPSAQHRDDDRVRFGASVTVRGSGGGERTYRIVGVPEADPAHGAVSFVSPAARALNGAAVGDVVALRAPGGEEELEIVAVAYAD